MVHYNKIHQQRRPPHRAIVYVRLLSLYLRLVNCVRRRGRSDYTRIETKKKRVNETFANRASSSSRILRYAKQLNWTTTGSTSSNSRNSSQSVSQPATDIATMPGPKPIQMVSIPLIYLRITQRNKWSKCRKTTTLFCTRQWNDDLFRFFACFPLWHRFQMVSGLFFLKQINKWICCEEWTTQRR